MSAYRRGLPPLTAEQLAAEEWRPLINSDRYEVSSLGRVRALYLRTPYVDRRRETPLILKQAVVRGYPAVSLQIDGKHFVVYVHRLVAEAFIGPRPKSMQVGHQDGCGFNNAASNLAYMSVIANARQKREHGTLLAGERSPSAKLTQAQADEIRALCAAGPVSPSALGKRYGVSPAMIWRIRRGLNWRATSPPQTPPEAP